MGYWQCAWQECVNDLQQGENNATIEIGNLESTDGFYVSFKRYL